MISGKRTARWRVAAAPVALGAVLWAGLSAQAPAPTPAELAGRCAAEARVPTGSDPAGKTFDVLDPRTAVATCEAAVAARPWDVDALANLGRALSKAERYAEARRALAAAAEGGSAQAQNNLASLYERGEGAAKDLQRARYWLLRAAAQGFALAQYNVGVFLENGTGGDKDEAQAAHWYRLAAATGHSDAQDSLAGLLEDGRGVKQDLPEAVRLLNLAVGQGHSHAQARLGYLYERGKGVPRDEKRAVELYRLSAEQENTWGQTLLASAYEEGRGVPPDPVEAFRLRKLAAEQGDADAQLSVGVAYALGHGVAVDEAQAAAWYRKAAEQGETVAQTNLADRFLDGRGVEQDPLEAHRLYKAAAEGGDTLAKNWFAALYNARRKRLETAPPAADDSAVARGLRLDGGDKLYALGVLYARGAGRAEEDPVQALQLFRAAAAQGHADARYALAEGLALGRGAEKDVPAALDLLEQGARAGHPESLATLAYPVAWFQREAGSRLDAARWRAALDRIANPEKQALAAFAVVSGKLVQQDFAGALKRLTALERTRAVDLHSARVSMLIDMQLYSAAAANFLRFARSDAFKALPEPARRELIRRFNQDIELACGWKGLEHADPTDLEALHALGVTGAAYQLAQLYTEGAGVPQDHVRAVHWLQRGAEAGDRSALNHLGLNYMHGIGIAKDRTKARELFKTAAQKESLGAMINYGLALENGWGGPEDPSTAYTYYRRALDGYTRAAVYIAPLYREGRGVQQSYEQAAAYYRRAAETGDGQAQNALGQLYQRGQGVPRDLEQALGWYRLSHQEGDPGGTISLGRLYEKGLGVERNEAEAARLYRLAAKRSNAEGRFEVSAVEPEAREAWVALARLHAEGRGVPRDPAEAVRLLKLAAEDPGVDSDLDAVAGDGFVDANIELARLHARGAGVPRDGAAVRTALSAAQKAGSKKAAGWLKACEATPTPECFAGLKALFLQEEPEPAGVQAATPPADEAAELKRLTAAVEKALEAGGGAPATRALWKLEHWYALRGRTDDLLQTRIRMVMEDEAALRARYGALNNYFALLTSSCHWGQASKLAHQNGRPEAALFFAKVSVNRLQEARGYIKDLDDDLRECFLDVHKDRYRWLADLFIEMGRFVEAENVLAMLKDFELRQYTRAADPGSSLDAMPLSADQSATLATAERATNSLALAAKTKARLNDARSNRELTPAEAAERQAAVDALDAASTAFKAELGRLQTAVAGLDRKGAEPARGWIQALPSIRGTVKKLGPEVAALHAVVLPNRIQWLLTTAEYQKSITVDVPESELNTAVGAFREALQDNKSDAAAPGRALYDLVFRGVDAELKAAGAKHVMLSLDMGLRYVPFAALHDGGDWLVKRYAFSQFRPDTDSTLLDDGPSEWRIAGFGSSQEAPGFRPLPQVVAELRAVVPQPQSVWLDGAFTKAALKSALQDDYNVVHIATHFHLSPRSPEKPFLLLGAGEKLTLDDFWSQYDLADVDLLALSACQTAVASDAVDGAEIDGMGGLAQNAGAKAVLASLWPVADDSTAKLMQQFYERRRSGGLDKAAALREAQLRIMGMAADGTLVDRNIIVPAGEAAHGPQTYAHPFFWAPFILLGNFR
jgi:TPR repeat protein/CHAT domain-containing protein